jgi:hypothetical protein
MRSLLAACTLLGLAGVPSTQANEWHVCQFDQDEKVLSYTLPEGMETPCTPPASMQRCCAWTGATEVLEATTPRGVLTVRGPSEALAIEGAVQTERDGRQALTISINTNSALVRLDPPSGRGGQVSEAADTACKPIRPAASRPC